MTTYRLIPAGDPRTDSAGYFEHKAHVAHLDNPAHQPRLSACALIATQTLDPHPDATVTDLGCGDGGLLTLIAARTNRRMWGYDIRRASIANARPGVDIRHADILTDPLDYGTLVIATELLEHLDDPQILLYQLHAQPDVRWLLLSSPSRETPTNSVDPSHVWAWDMDGYRELVEGAGWRTLRHVEIDNMFQILLVERS